MTDQTTRAPWTFTVRPEETLDDLTLFGAVGQAVGGASTCWSDIRNAGVFDSERAADIANTLEEWIEHRYVPTLLMAYSRWLMTAEGGGTAYTSEQKRIAAFLSRIYRGQAPLWKMAGDIVIPREELGKAGDKLRHADMLLAEVMELLVASTGTGETPVWDERIAELKTKYDEYRAKRDTK